MKGRDVSTSEQNTVILPEYGTQKLLDCADAYRSIAKVILKFYTTEKTKDTENRQGLIYHRQTLENQHFMAEQYLDVANRLSQVAVQSYRFVPAQERHFRQLVKCLKREGIEMKHLYFMENENRDGVMEITMKVGNEKERIPASDVADVLSLYYNMQLKLSVKSPYFVETEYKSFTFVQEPAYCVLAGQATAIKNGEEISGDNILVTEVLDGHIHFMLADGVGSGETAGRHSEKVLDFMEKFLMAGYTKENAIQVLNGLILQNGEEAAMSTLDICDMNLYTGVCEFNKIGAAASFHKRDYLVEKIWIENLPLGAFGTVDLDVARRRLEDGDYIIMITDGILDGLIDIGQEERLTDFISRMSVKNPKEMAQQILQYCISLCRGDIKDDMSVLVFGMWDN